MAPVKLCSARLVSISGRLEETLLLVAPRAYCLRGLGGECVSYFFPVAQL